MAFGIAYHVGEVYPAHTCGHPTLYFQAMFRHSYIDIFRPGSNLQMWFLGPSMGFSRVKSEVRSC